MARKTFREALADIAAHTEQKADCLTVIGVDGRLYTPDRYRECLEKSDPALLASLVEVVWGDYCDPERGDVRAYVWRWREDRDGADEIQKPVCTVEIVHRARGEASR